MINRKVTYGRLQSLGDYSNVKVEVTLETDWEDDITVTALMEGARHEVEVEVDRALRIFVKGARREEGLGGG